MFCRGAVPPPCSVATTRRSLNTTELYTHLVAVYYIIKSNIVYDGQPCGFKLRRIRWFILFYVALWLVPTLNIRLHGLA